MRRYFRKTEIDEKAWLLMTNIKMETLEEEQEYIF
jgi:hypothetical protein